MRNTTQIAQTIQANFIVILILFSGLVFFVLLQNLDKSLEDLRKERVSDMLDVTYTELNYIYTPIHADLVMIKEHAANGIFDQTSNNHLLNYFEPLLRNNNEISAVMIASDNFTSVTIDLDTVFLSGRISGGRAKTSVWERGKNGLIEKKVFPDSMMLDVQKRPWYKLAGTLEQDEVDWTEPYMYYTTHQIGITAVTKTKSRTNSTDYVIACDVSLNKISGYTSKIRFTPNSMVLIVDSENRVIALPYHEKFVSPDSMEHYLLKKVDQLHIPILTEAIRKLDGVSSDMVELRLNKQRWWCGVKNVNLGKNDQLRILAVVPEADFREEARGPRNWLLAGFGLMVVIIVVVVWSFIQKTMINRQLREEKRKNEQLLLNTLPAKVVNDLMEKGYSKPEQYQAVSVMFVDIVDFTAKSSKKDPQDLVNELNEIYSAYDEIIIKNKCERIKTIGDCYMAVSGIPDQVENHAELLLISGIEIVEYMKKRKLKNVTDWSVRTGIHSGGVVGGIVGIKKYIFDIFGDTINTASRMESNSSSMRINISGTTYELLKNKDVIEKYNIHFTERSPVDVKGKGLMQMYYVDWDIK